MVGSSESDMTTLPQCVKWTSMWLEYIMELSENLTQSILDTATEAWPSRNVRSIMDMKWIKGNFPAVS